MASVPRCELSEKFFVGHLPSASIPGTRLRGILERIDAGAVLNASALSFLEKISLVALRELAAGRIGVEEFRQRATVESVACIALAKEQAAEADAETARKDAAMDAAIHARFKAIENDPDLRRRREARELRTKYGIGFIDPDHYPRLMKLLRQLDIGTRLAPEHFVWLSTKAVDCWNDPVRTAYHRLEARAFADEWSQTGNARAAANASGHWRKADEPGEALEITEAALKGAGLAPPDQSALRTTRGGAMRDLGRLAEAKDLGHEAHAMVPNDFRPCTLLGAVYMQLGHFATGQEWYEKAEARGAERHAIDGDIRRVLARAAPDVKEELRAFLLSQDLHRFAWVRRSA